MAVISLVTKYGVRIDLNKLLALTQPKTPMTLLNELEKEYFIQIVLDVEPRMVEAMHPIRSNIIFEILFNDGILDWFEYFKKSIQLCYRKDLQFYLLNIIYDYFDFQDRVVSFFMGYKFKTWNELHAIYKALQWLDIKNYYILNKDLISEIYAEVGRAWIIIFDINISLLNSGNKWPFWRNLPELSGNTKLENYSRRQISKLEVFKLSRHFLNGISNFELTIESDEDWLKVSEVVFLSYHFNVSTSLDSFIGNVDYEKFLSFPIEIFSKLILAFVESRNNHFVEWYTKNKENILNKYKKEMEVERISEEADTIKIGYFLKGLNFSDGGMETSKAYKENMEKLRVLREIVPDKKIYSSNVYGQVFITDDQPDELHKDLERQYLLPVYLPEINSTFQGVSNYNFRLNNWWEYYQAVISQRLKVIENHEDISIKIKNYFFKRKISDRGFFDEILGSFNETEREVSRTILLPKIAVDQFGTFYEGKELSSYNAEEMKNDSNNSNNKIHKGVFAKFEFDRKYRDCFEYLKYFLHKAKTIFPFNSILSKGDKNKLSNFEQIKNMKPENFENFKHISIMNLKDAYKNLRDYQDSFREIFNQYIKSGGEKKYNEIEDKEIKNFDTLLPIWYQFAHFPKTTFYSSPRLKENYIKSYLSSQLKKLTNSIGRLCVEDYCIKGCFETIIDGDNSVVFQCDLKSPDNVDDSLRKTEKALFGYFKDFSYTSIDFCIMDIFRRQFVFLFTFKNKVFQDYAFRITLHDLKNKQSILENILLRSMRSISLDKFQEESFYKSLSRFDDEFLKCFSRVTSEFLQFIFLLWHFNKCLDFPFEDEITNYDYVNKMLKELGPKFKDVFSQLEDMEDQYKKNAIDPPQALKEFRDYLSLLSTDNGGKTFEISRSKFDEIISLVGVMIGGVSEAMLIYIKNKYGD